MKKEKCTNVLEELQSPRIENEDNMQERFTAQFGALEDVQDILCDAPETKKDPIYEKVIGKNEQLTPDLLHNENDEVN